MSLRTDLLAYVTRNPGRSATEIACALTQLSSVVSSELRRAVLDGALMRIPGRGALMRIPGRGPRGGYAYYPSDWMDMENVPCDFCQRLSRFERGERYLMTVDGEAACSDACKRRLEGKSKPLPPTFWERLG